MIDLNLVLEQKDFLKQQLAKKGYEISVIDVLEELLINSKSLKRKLEELRRQRNEARNDVSISNDKKRELRDQISQLEKDLSNFETKILEIHLLVPNMPDEDAPLGASEKDNIVIIECDDYKQPDVIEPSPHWELGEKLGILDLNASSKMSGSMFSLFKGKGAQLLRALVNYGLSLHNNKYLEIVPPHMVSSKTLTYTGHLPKFSEEQYKAVNDDLWLIPTAEVPLTSYFSDKLLNIDELPQRIMAYTVCFRREAGSYGKDTRGLQRLHEFHKVELVKVVEPTRCKDELMDLLSDCLKIIKNLKLQYRVVDLCTGDMGDKYGRCYDIEVFAPGVGKWLEVSSVGHFSDYQARRANIRYRTGNGINKFAYTLNGSGIATPRVWAAIIETYQQMDGSIIIPDVLVPFMGCETIK